MEVLDIPPPACPPPPQSEVAKENANPNKVAAAMLLLEKKKRRHASRRMTMSVFPTLPPEPIAMVTPLRTSCHAHHHSSSGSPAALDNTPLPLSPAEHAAGCKLFRVLRSLRIHRKWHTLVAEYPKSQQAAKARKRNCVMREVVSTERSYVTSLTSLVSLFIAPLRESLAQKSPILPEAMLPALFGNIEGIRELNATLLRDLDDRAKEWPSNPCIGDILLRNIDFFRIYIGFVNRYSAAHDTLDRLRRTSKPLQDFLAAVLERNPDSLDITGYLIMPIQRIPRYKLLLEDLLKTTEPEHADYDNLAKSLVKIRELAETINERKRDTDSSAKVAEVQALLFDQPSTVALPAAHRRFVRSGPLLRLEASPVAHSKLPAAKNPYLVVFNDMVLFVDKQQDTGRLRYRDIWQLSTLMAASTVPAWWPSVSASLPEEITRCTFSLSVSGNAIGSAVLAATAVSQEEKASWVEDLSRITEAIQEKRKKSASKSHHISIFLLTS